MKDGDQIIYIREDAGQVLDTGLWLVPGQPLTVGTDVTAELAALLVEDRACAPVSGSSLKAEAGVTETAPVRPIGEAHDQGPHDGEFGISADIAVNTDLNGS